MRGDYDSVVDYDREERRTADRWPLYHEDLPDDRPDARELAEERDHLRALRRKGQA